MQCLSFNICATLHVLRMLDNDWTIYFILLLQILAVFFEKPIKDLKNLTSNILSLTNSPIGQ